MVQAEGVEPSPHGYQPCAPPLSYAWKKVADRARVELASDRVTTGRSTIELPVNVVCASGVEPESRTYKVRALPPLSYAQVVLPEGFEPSTLGLGNRRAVLCATGVNGGDERARTSNTLGQNQVLCRIELRPYMVSPAGIEPASSRLEGGRLVPLDHGDVVRQEGLEPSRVGFGGQPPRSRGRREVVDTAGIEPASAGCKPAALPIELRARRWTTAADSNRDEDALQASAFPFSQPWSKWCSSLDSNQPVRVRSAEPSSRGRSDMERSVGIKPTSSVWKTEAQSLRQPREEIMWHRRKESNPPRALWRRAHRLGSPAHRKRIGVADESRTRQILIHSQAPLPLGHGYHTFRYSVVKDPGAAPRARTETSGIQAP